MINVTLYVRDNCPECEQAIADLKALEDSNPHRLNVVNITNDRGLLEKLGERLPVLEIGPYILRAPFKQQDLRIVMSAARDRIDQMERIDQETYQKRVEQGRTMSGSDRVTRFLGYHYLAIAVLALLIYVGLPFVAPLLMKVNQPLPASIIYRVYSPMCHQLAFRSWFLFGQQAYYPRQLAEIPGIASYESVVNADATDIAAARSFLGNEAVGYKVALCQRDVAIYLFMALFGIIFALTGRKMRSLPWYIWVVLGMGPIGLDGVSQLPSLASSLPDWLPIRESTPLLRTLTGGMFGWVTAWYLFPMIEETAREARRLYRRKEGVLDYSDPASSR